MIHTLPDLNVLADGMSYTLSGGAVFVARLEARSAVAWPDPALARTWFDWLSEPLS